jgi:hypothetical protein
MQILRHGRIAITMEIYSQVAAADTRDYQPGGLPPDRPNVTRRPHPDRHPDPGQTAPPQPESRLAAGHPQGPGLDPGEDCATINSRDAGL